MFFREVKSEQQLNQIEGMLHILYILTHIEFILSGVSWNAPLTHFCVTNMSFFPGFLTSFTLQTTVNAKVTCKSVSIRVKITNSWKYFKLNMKTYKDDAIEDKHHAFEEPKTSHFLLPIVLPIDEQKDKKDTVQFRSNNTVQHSVISFQSFWYHDFHTVCLNLVFRTAS